MAVLRERDRNKPVIRQLRRLKDGKISNATTIAAARLVKRGSHVYVDGGTDDTVLLKTKQRTLASMEKEKADVIPLAKVQKIETSGEGEIYTGPRRTLRSDSAMAERGSTAELEPKANRKVTKVSAVPKEKLEFIKRSNVANPAPALSDKNAGSLKNIIDGYRSRRK